MPQLAIVKDQPDDLRVRLRETIRYRDALLDDAAKAQSAFDNSKHLLCDAAERAQALKAELDAEQRAATARHSRAILAALRAGLEPPPAEPPVEADTAALTAALAAHDALELAYRELAAEAGEAHGIARAAAVQVDLLIDDVLDLEGHQLAERVIATQHAHWDAFDLLTGLVSLDEARAEPKLRKLQDHVVGQIDRRKLNIARNPLMIEEFNWRGYLTDVMSDALRLWQDYRARLRRDPEAKLDVE